MLTHFLYFWNEGDAGDAHHARNAIGDNVGSDEEEGEMLYNLVGGGKTMDGPKQGLSLSSALLQTNQSLPHTILVSYHITLPDNILPFDHTNANGLANLH